MRTASGMTKFDAVLLALYVNLQSCGGSRHASKTLLGFFDV